MKKMFLVLLLLAGGRAFSQTADLVFFSEQGERFSIVLNGVLQNETPRTNIKVTGLNQPTYKLKVIFEDKNLGEIDKTLMFGEGKETTFNIKKNNKGEWVVRYQSEVPIAEELPPPPTQEVVVYTPVPRQTTTVTHTETTTINSGVPSMGVGVSVTEPASGANIEVNVNTGAPSGTASTTYSTTTTTTTSVGDPEHREHHEGYHEQGYDEHFEGPPGYEGPHGCRHPMRPTDFASVKQSISSKTFEDSKIKIAKQVIDANCLLCSQVKEIMLLFTFESTRLELAKYAYGHTFDIGNYYKLNDAFTFESSIDELNEYIKGERE